MHISYELFHREVASATRTLLILTAACFGLAMVSALLGLPQAVISFRGAALSVAYAFAILLALFLLSSLLGAVFRWKDRRSPQL